MALAWNNCSIFALNRSSLNNILCTRNDIPSILLDKTLKWHSWTLPKYLIESIVIFSWLNWKRSCLSLNYVNYHIRKMWMTNSPLNYQIQFLGLCSSYSPQRYQYFHHFAFHCDCEWCDVDLFPTHTHSSTICLDLFLQVLCTDLSHGWYALQFTLLTCPKVMLRVEITLALEFRILSYVNPTKPPDPDGSQHIFLILLALIIDLSLANLFSLVWYHPGQLAPS